MATLYFVPGGSVVDERVGLDEGAADDARRAAELRADGDAVVGEGASAVPPWVLQWNGERRY